MKARALAVGLLFVAVVTRSWEASAVTPPEERPARITAADRFFDIKAAGERVFVTVGYKGRIVRTEDGGTNWREVQSPTTAALLRLCFVDAEYGWAVGHQGVVLHTQDGGKSWQAQKSGTPVALFAVSCIDRLHAFAVGDSSTFLRSQDGGRSWEVRQVPLSLAGIREDMTLAISDTIYYGMHFVDARSGWIVGEYGNIRHTTDGGETWDSEHASLLGGAIRDAMDLPAFFDVRVTGSSAVAVGGQGKIAVSKDGGQTWRFVNEGRRGSDALYEITAIPAGGLLLVGGGGFIARGADDSWQAAAVPQGVYGWLAGADVAASGNGFVVGSDGILLQTQDFGKTWTTATWRGGSTP